MATEFINGQWRIPNSWNVDESNQNKVSNYSMDFNGTSDFIDLGSDVLFDSTKGFSFSAWVNINSYSPLFPGICRIKTDQSKGFIIFLGNQSPYQGVNIGSISGFIRAKTVGDIGGDFIGTWKHVCVTFDGVNRDVTSSYKIYVDGLSVDLTSTGSFSDSPNANFLGNATTNSATYLNGKLDQTCIFNYELTQAQIDILYGNSAAGYFQIGNPMALTPNPVAFYPLGDQALIGAGYNGANWLIPNQVVVRDSFVFDFSATQFIGCGNNSSINQVGTVFTMSCWVNTTSQVRGSIMGTFSPSNYGGYFIELMPNGTVFGGFNENIFNSSSKSSLATVDDGNWHHVCYTISGINTSDINVYIDGVASNGLFGQQGNPTTANTTNSFQINNQSIIPSNARYIGLTSNVQVFTATLTGSEVSTLYNNGIPLLILSSIPQNSSLQGWWKLNETTTLIAGLWVVPDDSANTNGGLSSGMTASNRVLSNLPKAASRYVFDFNGSTQNINIDNEITLPSNHSLSFWLNFDTIPTVSGAGPIPLSSSTNNYYPMITAASGKIQLYIKGTVGFINKVTNTALIANTWYHIVVTSDGTNALYYINGGADSGVIGSARTGVSIKSIGSRLNGASRSLFVDGRMSNVAIWSGNTLTSSQVTTLYNNGSPPADISSLSPTAWYKLNAQDTFDGTNWTIKDYAGSNNSTSNGMTSASLVLSDLPSENAGYSPYAIELNGTDQNFLVDNSSEDLNVDYLTVSAWFKPDALQSFKTLIGNRYFDNGFMSWAVQLKVDGTIRYIQKTPGVGGAFVSTDTYNANAWNHVAVTYDGTNAKIYLNGGTPVVIAVGGGGPIQYDSGFISDNVTIGSAAGSGSVASPGPPSQFIDGQLSNVAVWGSGLSAAQVTTIYNNGIPGDISSLNPLAWWELGSMMGFNGVDTYTALSNTDSNFAAVSTANMAGGNVVNGPGYSDGGIGTSSLVIEKQAPYSFNNALSESMAISNRDDSQASDPYPYIFELDLSAQSNPFTWNSPSMNTVNDFPFTVDWGDGTVESIEASDLVSNKLQHVYDTSAYPRPVIQYGRADDVGQVYMTGAAGTQPTASRNVVRFIKQIGNIPWKQLRFYQLANATSKVQLTDIADLSGAGLHPGQTTFASLMFQSTKLNIANVSDWDVSTINTASSMFYIANLPSQDFSKWDTSSQRAGQSAPGILNLLNLTFTNNKAFNGNITNWLTTRATSGNQTFSGASAFNQDVSTKYISAANSPTGAAYVAWDTSNITNMASMFFQAKAFNQDISNWDTSKVVNMNTMFSGASVFNQDVNTKQVTVNGVTYTAWDVSKVTSFTGMLLGTVFNNTFNNWELNAGLTKVSQIFLNNNTISNENFSDNWAIFANSVKDDNSAGSGAASNSPQNVNATGQNNSRLIKVNRTAPVSTGGVTPGTQHFPTCGRALSYLTSDVQITVNEEEPNSVQLYTADFLDTATSSYPYKLVGVDFPIYTFQWNGTAWQFENNGVRVETDTGNATLQQGPEDGTWNFTVQTANQNWNFNNTGTVYTT